MKKSKRELYRRDRMEKAIQYVNAWATVKWHRIHGGDSLPSGVDDLSASSCKRGSPSDMPSLFDAAVSVDYCLKRFGNPLYLRALLLWLYPRSGVYARDELISSFDPKGLSSIMKLFGWSRNRMEAILADCEKRFIRYVSDRI